ncbi:MULTISPECIES: c-type cytochrome [Nitrospirillum]|uniref:Cytochrome c556 n=1 Tax=Nitrospirillum amazonense TaxID=28077 RepID=A0A560G9Z9_9PROT|nr:cytochrome c [Nitrospirillum amazonense]MEC4591299.1 cytochrome c [Nitrospirillum amazonense]TWB30712.1 cytochrome c556 [Nitrospirillum amazonense]
MPRAFRDVPQAFRAGPAVRIAAGLALAAALLGGSVAHAALDPAEIVKARQQDMKKLGGGMKVFMGYLKDDKGTAQDVAAAAAAMEAVTKGLPDQFTEGTDVGVGESEALPVIWQENAKFRQGFTDLAQALDKILALPATADKAAIGQAVQAVGGTCKQCHETYRQKK